MGKLLVTLVIVLFFGCSPDKNNTDQKNKETSSNSPLNEEVDEVDKIRKELKEKSK